MEGEGIIECTISDEQSCLQEEDVREISKIIWVLEKGLRLGRKIVITGIVVSSAPLVIPPLITISILGFVGMVPVGFVLVTEKLMSKLLPMPMPAPPLLLEYPAQMFRDGNRFEEFEEELCGRDFETEFEVHEEMMMEGEGVEHRIELVMDKVAVDNEEESQYVEKHDYKKEIDIDENLEGEHKYKKEIIIVDEEVVEFSEAECEYKKDINIDENLEKGYEEEGVECLATGEYKDKKEIIIVDEEVVEFMEVECEDKKDTNIDENLEKGYDEDAGEYFEGEDEEKKEINIHENLEEEGYEEAVGEYLEEHEDEKDNIDQNMERGYEEDVGEYLEGGDEDKKEINIDENLDAIGEYLEGEHEGEKDNIDENLEKGYEEDGGEYLEGGDKDNKEININENLDEGNKEAVGEYLEGEHEDTKDNIDENLEKGYEVDAGEYLEGEHEDKKEINIDENSDEGYADAIGEYLEGEHNKDLKDIDENLEKGYLEGEYQEKKQINIHENLGEGYEDAIGEYLEGEREDEKDNIDENLEKGYEEDAGEYLEGEHKDNKVELIIDEEVVEFLEAEENFEFKRVTLLGKVGSSVKEDEEHLEKPIGFEEEDKKEATSAKRDENPFNGTDADVKITVAEVKVTEASLKENECAPETEKHNEINSNEGAGALSSEAMVIEEKIWEQISAITISEGEKDNVDENLEKGYEEDAGEYLEVEDEDKKEINTDENLDEGYGEAIGEYLKGEHEDMKDNIDENLEKGYEEDAGEYLEGEDEDKKQINIDENLGEGYEEAIGDYLEREGEDEKHNNIDENLEKGYEEDEDIDEDLEEGYEEDVGEYLKGEHEEPMPEMNMEVERGSEEPHFEFGENVKRTEGLDLVGTSARGENYKNNDNKAEENFEFTSVTLLVNVSSTMKEDEEHLEKPRGFKEEDQKEVTSAKEDENPFNVTNAEVEMTVAEVKVTEAILTENECAPETEKHNEFNSNDEGAEAPSSEVMVIEEEKIWEQISAIRGILGYTATPQSSTVDELKALFILTGVEPPSPFEDPSDLVDVNHKLRLLMSIVGTK